MYGIYTNIGGILMGSMLPYIAAPWILWVTMSTWESFTMMSRTKGHLQLVLSLPRQVEATGLNFWGAIFSTSHLVFEHIILCVYRTILLIYIYIHLHIYIYIYYIRILYAVYYMIMCNIYVNISSYFDWCNNIAIISVIISPVYRINPAGGSWNHPEPPHQQESHKKPGENHWLHQWKLTGNPWEIHPSSPEKKSATASSRSAVWPPQSSVKVTDWSSWRNGTVKRSMIHWMENGPEHELNMKWVIE